MAAPPPAGPVPPPGGVDQPRQKRSLPQLARFELRHAGFAHAAIFILFAGLALALPYSGNLAAIWQIVRDAPAWGVGFAVLAFFLLYHSNRASILGRSTNVRVTIAQFSALQLVIFLAVLFARWTAGEIGFSGGSVHWPLAGDMLLQAQVALPLILLLWRLAGDKPKCGQTLRALLNQARSTGCRLVALTGSPEPPPAFNQALAAHRASVDALEKAVPDPVACHPWEETFLVQLKKKASDARSSLSRSSPAIEKDLVQDGPIRNLIASWPI